MRLFVSRLILLLMPSITLINWNGSEATKSPTNYRFVIQTFWERNTGLVSEQTCKMVRCLFNLFLFVAFNFNINICLILSRRKTARMHWSRNQQQPSPSDNWQRPFRYLQLGFNLGLPWLPLPSLPGIFTWISTFYQTIWIEKDR